MRLSAASLLLALSAALWVGCAKPDLDFEKVRLGMPKKEIIARLGEPTRTTATGGVEVFEYEAFDRYGALKVNRRSQFVRFVDGRAESFGNIEDLPTGRRLVTRRVVEQTAGQVPPPEAGTGRPAASFDLRAELEKLGKLKADGLISEAEFQDLRQRLLEKAKAQ